LQIIDMSHYEFFGHGDLLSYGRIPGGTRRTG
jgi:hypothetical protein